MNPLVALMAIAAVLAKATDAANVMIPLNEERIMTLNDQIRGRFRDFLLVESNNTVLFPGSVEVPACSEQEALWVVELPIEQLSDPPSQQMRSFRDLNVAANINGSAAVCHPVEGTGIDYKFFGKKPTFIRVPSYTLKDQQVSSDVADTIMRSLSSVNTKITKALQAVSADELSITVTHLSDYYTRQSASIEARQAEGWLADQFITYGFEVNTVPFNANYSSNVIAELRGTVYPDKFIIVGGHYDSRSTDSSSPTMRAPGADDDGTGTAALVEIARVFNLLNIKTEYSVRLVAFSGEEQGLLGSEAYAKELKANDVEVIAMFNADMLGYKLPGTTPKLGMKDRYITPWLLSTVHAVSALYVPTLEIGSSSSCCSDYKSFFDLGYPAVGFFENTETASAYPYYHTSKDLPQHVDFDQAALAVQSVLANTLTFATPE